MGYTTDFLGHIDITPPLNDHEAAYLSAFGHTRHWDRADGPYDIPGNPLAEDSTGLDVDSYHRTARGKPHLYCQWSVCWEGCCLAYNGVEKFYDSVQWLEYLTDHFLRPGARARASGLPAFKKFTFDHRLDGVIVACRRDTRELLAICVDDNVVRTKVLVPGSDQYRGLPRLPYEEELDRWADDLAAIRSSGRGVGGLPDAG